MHEGNRDRDGVRAHGRSQMCIRDRSSIASFSARRKSLCNNNYNVLRTYKLVGDITYLRTGQGWLYLATVIDLCTRMVVGWSLSERMTADIAVAALESAKSRGYVAGNAIFHSDSTPAGSSRSGRATTTCACRAAAPAAATTTPWPSRSSRR